MTSNVQRASLGIVARSHLDRRASVLAVAMLFAMNSVAQAHGFAGERFFPATILTDDPFVADEGSLPTITFSPTGPDGSRETDIGSDLSKRITSKLDFTLHTQWAQSHPVGAPTTTSWGGLDSGLQYQLFVNGPRESMGLVDPSDVQLAVGTVQPDP